MGAFFLVCNVVIFLVSDPLTGTEGVGAAFAQKSSRNSCHPLWIGSFKIIKKRNIVSNLFER
ncbi:hypothetical protein EB093_03205 [bacterium]|nr:hypothetical protein [bacterium]